MANEKESTALSSQLNELMKISKHLDVKKSVFNERAFVLLNDIYHQIIESSKDSTAIEQDGKNVISELDIDSRVSLFCSLWSYRVYPIDFKEEHEITNSTNIFDTVTVRMLVPWSNKNCSALADDVLRLLSLISSDIEWVMKLRSEMSMSKWKTNWNYVSGLIGTCQSLCNSYNGNSEYLFHLMCCCFALIDDPDPKNSCCGLLLLEQIIKAWSTLSNKEIANLSHHIPVIFQILEGSLYSLDQSVQVAVTRVLSVILFIDFSSCESADDESIELIRTFRKRVLDIYVDRLLSSTGKRENELASQVNIKFVSYLVEKMNGSYIIPILDKILKGVENYTRSTKFETRLEGLKLLEKLFIHAWARMKNHTGRIVVCIKQCEIVSNSRLMSNENKEIENALLKRIQLLSEKICGNDFIQLFNKVQI